MKYALLFSLLFLFSCKSNHDYLIDLNESLLKAAAEYKQNARYQTIDFEEKSRDPISAIKAKPYMGAVTEINNRTKEVEAVIDSMISNKHSISKDEVSLLFKKIKGYKNGVFTADVRIKDSFKHDFVILGNRADSLIRNATDLHKVISEKKTVTERNIFLNSIKSNIWYNTSHILRFLRTTITYHMPHYYPGPVLGCNTTVIQAGDSIKVFAAIGHFDWNIPYTVEIDGRTLTKNDDGIIKYDFAPKGRPGKYFLPVKFRYVDQDGKDMISETKIEYKIIN